MCESHAGRKAGRRSLAVRLRDGVGRGMVAAMIKTSIAFAIAALCLASVASAASALKPDPYATAEAMQKALNTGQTTSETLVTQALARIAAMDHAGPRLNAVISLNPHALADARARDAERRAGHAKGPLFGVPVLLKDNIEADIGVPTTAGSLALADNFTGRDAPLVKRLRDGGAIILGKTNLSQWANFRSSHSLSGWSSVGGMVRNPHSLDRTACGSSAGSGAAVAAGYVAVAIGTETDGSITCPSKVNGIVGFKPTVGLVPRSLIVPISAEQDTPGPMTRSVRDAAAVLSVISGSDPTDPATREADAHRVDFVAGLDDQALKGARIGVWRGTAGGSAPTEALFEATLTRLRQAGAILVDVKPIDREVRAQISAAEEAALFAEFKPAINAYLAATPARQKQRTLDDLIAFNTRTPAETALFGQETFEAAAKAAPLTDPNYLEQRATARRLATDALDKMMRDADVDLMIASSGSPAFIVDPVNGDGGGGGVSGLPAIAGAPHLTLPMGHVAGLPVGISVIGPRWSDAHVLSMAYAIEQATKAWRAPLFLANQTLQPQISAAFDPHAEAAAKPRSKPRH